MNEVFLFWCYLSVCVGSLKVPTTFKTCEVNLETLNCLQVKISVCLVVCHFVAQRWGGDLSTVFPCLPSVTAARGACWPSWPTRAMESGTIGVSVSLMSPTSHPVLTPVLCRHMCLRRGVGKYLPSLECFRQVVNSGSQASFSWKHFATFYTLFFLFVLVFDFFTLCLARFRFCKDLHFVIISIVYTEAGTVTHIRHKRASKVTRSSIHSSIFFTNLFLGSGSLRHRVDK